MAGIISVIDNLKGLVSLKGASKEAITIAESALGLSFSKDYTEYLEKYGVISARHIELTGITESKRLNVVEVTKLQKETNQFPVDMYVIEDTGIEGILILQNGNGEVYELQNQRTKKIFNSLSDYLLSK